MENEAQNGFGMTEQDQKNLRIKNFLTKLKYYFSQIEPGLVRLFQTILYWTLKIGKSVFTTVFRMILGKEV